MFVVPNLKKMLGVGVEGSNHLTEYIAIHQNRWKRLVGETIFGEGGLYAILVGLASASDLESTYLSERTNLSYNSQ
jgi:hypothetical protein